MNINKGNIKIGDTIFFKNDIYENSLIIFDILYAHIIDI